MSRNSYEIVVGLPSRNEADTIPQVAQVVDRGLSSFFPDRSVVIVNADNSSEDGTQKVFLETQTRAPKIGIDTGDRPPGKGKNVLAIFQFAVDHGAKVVCLFDTDVTSARADWVGSLSLPVLRADPPTMVTPVWTKNRFQGSTTNHLVYPCLYAVLGARVEQPISGVIAVNEAFAREALSQPLYDSTLGYGIDVLLTTTAIIRGYQISNVKLTKVLHGHSFPKILYIAQQVLDTLLRMLVICHLPMPVAAEGRSFEAFGRNSVDDHAVPPDDHRVAHTCRLVAEYLYLHGEALRERFPSLPTSFLEGVTARRGEADIDEHPKLPSISADLWCELLADGLTGLRPRNFYAIRDDLVALLLCRVLAHWQEIAGCTPKEVDALVCNQAVTLKRILAERNSGLPHLAKDDIPPDLRPGFWAERIVEEGG